MNFNPQKGAEGISIQWHFKCHMLELAFTSTDTIRDWNALPASIISSAESSEDNVASFRSHIRSRD